jgi:hexosaminidase
VPFNFQLGADRNKIELLQPASAAGELEVREDGCEGQVMAVLPLDEAAQRNEITILSKELSVHRDKATDLCFRFRADELDPMWAIDWIELVPVTEFSAGRAQ